MLQLVQLHVQRVTIQLLFAHRVQLPYGIRHAALAWLVPGVHHHHHQEYRKIVKHPAVGNPAANICILNDNPHALLVRLQLVAHQRLWRGVR